VDYTEMLFGVGFRRNGTVGIEHGVGETLGLR
jgi:hypothetical protein